MLWNTFLRVNILFLRVADSFQWNSKHQICAHLVNLKTGASERINKSYLDLNIFNLLYFQSQKLFYNSILLGLVVDIPVCHAGGQGSTPGRELFFLLNFSTLGPLRISKCIYLRDMVYKLHNTKVEIHCFHWLAYLDN